MKKLFNSRFLFILASSLVVLILLTVGAFYLFDDEDDVFIKSGYVLNPLSSTSEKYFFNENAGYKENLSSMIEFVDVDDNTVSVLKDSFLHYEDESISFLKKGALLDLDTLKGTSAVSFYNITNKSIIEKKDSGYFIESAAGDVRMTNFIGRISDNKYIVVGDLSLKMAGNATTIKGDYFEIVYVEEGIVNVENKSVKYQVAADDTLIYFGSDKVIDLGDKKITVNDVDLMSITSITIDGDENIEIIPKGNEDEEEPDGGSDDTNSSDDTGNNPGNEGTPGEDVGGTGNGNQVIEPTEEVVVSLKNAKTGSTNIDVVFDVVNAKEDDVFKLQVVNLNSGRTVDLVAEVLPDVEIKVNLLTPNTKYLFSVINEKDNGKYFQKVLETTGFGIKLEKSYATDSSLSYKIIIDEGTDITNAKLTLYKFNETTNKNEVVTETFTDPVTGEETVIEKISYLSNIKENLEGEHEILFDGLDSDTIYTAVLDEFSVASSNFKDIYNITVTAMTLKQIPKFTEMTITKNVGAGSFDLSLGQIDDPDNAIVGYTYMIYDRMTNEMAIDPIFQSNASPITVKVGMEENQLHNDTNYYYQVIIEYFDNEKYIEYVTSDSIIFMMGNDPYVTVVPNEKAINHEKIEAAIYLTDNSCLVSMPGREKCSGNSTVIVNVYRVIPMSGPDLENPVMSENVTFDVSDEEIKYNLHIDKKLLPGTTYLIEVKATLNNSNDLVSTTIEHTPESKQTITTKSLASFKVDWTNLQGNIYRVVDTMVQLVADKNAGTLSPEESLASINKVVLKLYEGKNTMDLNSMRKLGEVPITNVNFKELFYDTMYSINSLDTFGLTLEDLKNPDTNKLSEYYTISIEAYTDSGYKLDLDDNVYPYKVSSILLMDDIKEPVIEIDGITNKASGNVFENINNATIVGYNVTASFDRNQLIVNNIIPQRINYYVYNTKKEKIKFYIKDEDGELKLVDKLTADLGENSFYEAKIYMDYGSSYETVDDVMRRGNGFVIGYEIETLADKEILLYPLCNDPDAPSEYGVYSFVASDRQNPSIKMYISKTDSSSVTYSYTIEDPDNAIYKEAETDNYSFYYIVNEGSEKKYELVRDEKANFNRFVGNISINGLYPGDLYKLYYKKIVSKTDDLSVDIVNYLDGYSSGVRMFDGYYNAKDNINAYRFKYQIINNAEKDNKVVIKILANEEILNRIVSYRLMFEDSKGHTLNKELWQLSLCTGDSEGDVPRCLFVDYTELKNAGMKSENNETNTIKLKIDALYDNGLTGYDFKVGPSDDADYLYCILQDNSSEHGMGGYVSFTASGQEVTIWNQSLGAPKGYYTYTLNNNLLFYKSQLNVNHRLNISVNLSNSGYSSKHGFLTPKMISVDEMLCNASSENCNTFSFSSITPKVSVTEKSAILNGNVLNFKLSGVDLNDIQIDKDKNYYLYVETWDSKENVGDLNRVVRPSTRVKIDKDNPTKSISGVIDGLKENTTYYYNVYAYMNKNGRYIYTQLFDAGISDRYEVKSYAFKTARANDLFHSLDVTYTSSDKIYGNRDLNTKINLLAYKNNIAFNFDIIYALCEKGTENCGIGEGETNIFKKVIPLEKITNTVINDSVDISQYDLEYDKDYYMYVYASVDYYNSASSKDIIKRNVVLNRYNINIKLNKLREPKFTVTRNASSINGDYYIDFTIVVNDPDRTLVDGNYYIKLLDSEDNLVGNMQLLDDDGAYYDVANYNEYAFDAFVVRKKVRIRGLEPDSRYVFVVYNDAYMNNYSADVPKEDRTYEVSETYTSYTTGTFGVAFGQEVEFNLTNNSIVLTFLGGSNFDNVMEVSYTAGIWGTNDYSTFVGEYVIGKNNKYFEYDSETDDWTFVITPPNMKNDKTSKYAVIVDFKIKDTSSELGYIVYSVEGTAVFK